MRNYVAPEDNVLIGSAAILRYIQVRSIVTLYQWVEKYGFPAVKRPDGRWMTTITAIDSWLFMGAEADFNARKKSRGSNVRADIALKQAIEQFGPDSLQAQNARDRLDRINNVRRSNPAEV